MMRITGVQDKLAVQRSLIKAKMDTIRRGQEELAQAAENAAYARSLEGTAIKARVEELTIPRRQQRQEELAKAGAMAAARAVAD